MADLFSIDIDIEDVLRAFDAAPEAIERHTKPAALITATNIAQEARARVRRRTGRTAEGIAVREDESRLGYVVVSERQESPNLPIWLERGTETMTARPYFNIAAALEEGPHERRMLSAVVDAIEELGLGE